MEEDETICDRCSKTKNEVCYNSETIEVDIEDQVPLIRRQQRIAAGASNLMVQWVSHITKLLLSGLITMAALITVLILYIVVAKAEDVHLSQGDIFMFDLSEKVSRQRLCTAESLVRLQPNVPCYFYLTSDPIPALNLLSDIYPNFYVRRWNWMAGIRETPMEQWLDRVEHLQALIYKNSKNALEMTARVLTLWKYGGTSKPLHQIINGDCDLLGKADGNGYHNTVDESDGTFINFDPCHAFIEKVILEIMNVIERGEVLNSTELITEQLRRICEDPKMRNDKWKVCKGIFILGPDSVCPIKPQNTDVGAYCPRVQSLLGHRLENRYSNRLNEF